MADRKIIEPNSDEEWDLEIRAFNAANDPDSPEETRHLVRDLWAAFVAREVLPENDADSSTISENSPQQVAGDVPDEDQDLRVQLSEMRKDRDRHMADARQWKADARKAEAEAITANLALEKLTGNGIRTSSPALNDRKPR